MVINPIVGVYIPIIRIPIKRWDDHPQKSKVIKWEVFTPTQDDQDVSHSDTLWWKDSMWDDYSLSIQGKKTYIPFKLTNFPWKSIIEKKAVFPIEMFVPFLGDDFVGFREYTTILLMAVNGPTAYPLNCQVTNLNYQKLL